MENDWFFCLNKIDYDPICNILMKKKKINESNVKYLKDEEYDSNI